MSMQKKPQMAEAVLFFNDSGVCKEMLYRIRGAARWPGAHAGIRRPADAPGLCVDQLRLQARAAVFFYLDFDEQGGADTGWNLPLRNLAERAGRGPDMGGGPIRLACRSQCPVSWHQMHLWDPESSAGRNHFVLIRDALRRNQLGLLVDEEPAAVEPQRLQMAAEEQWYAAGPAAPKAPPAEPPRKQEDEQTARLAQLVKQQRQQLAALARQQEQRLPGSPGSTKRNWPGANRTPAGNWTSCAAKCSACNRPWNGRRGRTPNCSSVCWNRASSSSATARN